MGEPSLNVSFAEFRKFDSLRRRQRSVLLSLQRLDVKLKADSKLKGGAAARKPFKGVFFFH
jgi:hypothetical protein